MIKIGEPSADEIRENSYWFIRLTDGRHIYQCDTDENGVFVNSWLETKKYLFDNRLKVAGLYLRFRDHIEEIAANKPGFYFIYSLLVDSGSGVHRYYNNVGYLENDHVHVRRFLLPELIETESYVRHKSDLTVQESLIVN